MPIFSQFKLSLSPILLALTLLGAATYVLPEFASVRPQAQSENQLKNSADEFPLWDDPLKEDDLTTDSFSEVLSKEVSHIKQHYVKQPQQEAGDVESSRILVIPCFLQPGKSPDAIESRIRTRRAVLTALGKAFAPHTSLKSATIDLELQFPLEVYRHSRFSNYGKSNLYRSVIILWINENTILNKKSTIGRIHKSLQDQLTSSVAVDTKYIGPRLSSTLDKLNADNLLQADLSTTITLISPSITSTTGKVFTSDALSTSAELLQVNFISPNDQVLSTLLLDELRARLWRTSSRKPPKILLISEWDSYYGRAFPYLIEMAAGKEFKIERVQYIKQLDGGVKKSGSSEKKNNQDLTLEYVGNLEKPQGQGQFDFLTRLSKQLKDAAKSDPYVAVGVVGSDVYDKLLILQALRASLPGVLFFTTDYDAWFEHPSQIKWTRNLVVASGFGLSPQSLSDSENQAPIPPFRDTYQTATYLATQKALGVSLTEFKPMLFEVGYWGATDLNIVSSTPSSAKTILHGVEDWLLLGIISATYIGLLYLRYEFRSKSAAAALVAGVLIIVVIAWCQAYLSDEVIEPFSLNGYSVYPGIVVLILTGIIAIILIVWILAVLPDREAAIAAKYGLKSPPVKMTAKQDMQTFCKGIVSSTYLFSLIYKMSFLKPPKKIGHSSPVSIWRRYRKGRHGIVLYSTGPFAVLFLIMIFEPFGGGVATLTARGLPAISAWHTTYTIAFSLLLWLSILLAFRVLILVLLLLRLADGETIWPYKTLKREGQKNLINEEYTSELVDVFFAGDLTAELKYPVLVLGILVTFTMFAKSKFIDNWHWSSDQFGIFVLLAFVWTISALALFGIAEIVRWYAVRNLKTVRNELRGTNMDAESLNKAIQTVAEYQKGAFAPIWKQPLIQSIFIPISAYLSVEALQFLRYWLI